MDELLGQVGTRLLLLVTERGCLVRHCLVHLHDGCYLRLDLLAIGLAWWAIVLVLVLNEVDLVEGWG